MANEFIIKNGFRSQGNSEVTGSAIISGSLSITGSLNVITGSAIVLNTSTLTLTDKNSKSSVGWDKRNLFDAGGLLSADWTLRLLYDSQATPSASVDWKNRLLKNNAGTTILDWQSGQFTGTASYALASGGGGGSPGGSDTYIQFNNAGAFGGEQFFTYNTGSRSIAQGNANSAIGTYSHAEGQSTGATGLGSHAEGDHTAAAGDYSHAEGEGTTATGQYSHAEGHQTTATGQYSHTEGYYTTATGQYSHAEGHQTTATGVASHAEGESTTANGDASHTEGASTTTGNTSGYYTEMTASGVFTISSSYGDVSSAGLFTAGYIIGVDDSQYDNTYNYANLIVTSCSFNGTNTIVYVTDTSFLTSTAIIGSISNFGNGGDRAWGGYGAHAQGSSTTAQGAGSHAEGQSASAYGTYSHAEGESNTYGNFSHAEGGGTAYGQYSHAEGNGAVAYGTYSHAEGESSIAGYNGYRMNTDITAGVIKLKPIYGDQTANFSGGSFVLIYDNSGDIDTVNGTSTTYLYEVSSSAFTSSLTQITLVDNTVTTFTNLDRVRIGVYGNAQPTAADVPLGNASHAEGVGSKTIGEYSHAAGNITETLGWYQSVVGIGNKPISTLGAFIVGDGTIDGNTRHNLLVAASGSVAISGSLILTPTASGAPTSPGTDGQIIFGQAGGNYKIYVWLGGAWRSGSLS